MISETRTIPLSRGLSATVDAADYDALGAFKWHAQTHHNTFCAARNAIMKNGKRGIVYMHRVIMGEPVGMVVDHIDRNPLNNRRSNLRLCSTAENSRNRVSAKRSTSQYLGVSRCGKQWQAGIRILGKKVNLGVFANGIDAARAYDAAARKHHGEFANPNFKDVQP